MTDTRQARAAPTEAQVLAAARMLCKIHAGQCQVDEDDTWKVYGEQFKDDARDALIAALSAQPVAGAVALWQYRWTNPAGYEDEPAEALEWKELVPRPYTNQTLEDRIAELRGYEHNGKAIYEVRPLYAAPQPQAAPAPEPSAQAVREPGDPLHDDAYVRGVAVGFVEDDSRRTTLLRIADRMQKLAAAPQPAPSVQAVAHPSHQTVREWMPVSEALRLSDLWTAGDLDNCGQWRAAIKVLADEVRASAPSTPPHAVVEAVPLEWTEELGPMPGTPYNHCAASTPFGRFLITWKGWKENDWPTVDETPWGDFLGSWRTVKEAQAACEAEYAIRLLRGIAPKAAQPNVGGNRLAPTQE